MNNHSALVNDILRAIGSRPDVRVWKNHTGAAMSTDRFVKFGLVGQADITGIHNTGRRIEIECKTGTGQLTKNQRNFARMIKKYGGIYVLARQVSDVVDALNSVT